MRKIGIGSLVVGFLVMGLLPLSVHAQVPGRTVTFNIPFAFMVGDTKLPAGKYEIAKVADWSFRITNLETHQSVMFATEATPILPTPAKSFTLYFNLYGDQYYLSKFYHRGETAGDMIPMTDAEKELAKKVPATVKTIIGKTT